MAEDQSSDLPTRFTSATTAEAGDDRLQREARASGTAGRIRACSSPSSDNPGQGRAAGRTASNWTQHWPGRSTGRQGLPSPSRATHGAGDRVRTDDILLGRQMLYQLSYARVPARRCADQRVPRAGDGRISHVVAVDKHLLMGRNPRVAVTPRHLGGSCSGTWKGEWLEARPRNRLRRQSPCSPEPPGGAFRIPIRWAGSDPC